MATEDSSSSNSDMSDEENDDKEDFDVDDVEAMDEEVSEEQIAELEKKVQDNGHDYLLHSDLITALRKAGEFDKLRRARELMRQRFPLMPDIWLAWIQDEITVGTDKEDVRALFERALCDFTSCELWLEYCQWVTGALKPNEAREVFEAAVNSIGSHVQKGVIIWDVYRMYEAAQLELLNGEKSAEYGEQVQRVLSIFKRELSTPLLDIKEAFDDYQTFLTDHSLPADASVHSHYDVSQSELKDRLLPLEDRLEQALKTPDDSITLLDAFRSYWTYEMYKRLEQHPDTDIALSRISCIFERALCSGSRTAPLCLSADLWLDYAKALDLDAISTHVLPSRRTSLLARATRNCPWSAPLWLRYLLCIEASGGDWWPLLETVFTQCLTSDALKDANNAVELSLAYTYAMRRRGVTPKELSATLAAGAERLREMFGRGGALWDPQCRYRRAWAALEGRYGEGARRMKEIYTEEILSWEESWREMASVWLEFDWLARVGPNDYAVEARRSLLHKAVEAVRDFPESVGEALVQFEREEGSVETLRAAINLVELRRARKERRHKPAAMGRQAERTPREATNKRSGGRGGNEQRSMGERVQQRPQGRAREPQEKGVKRKGDAVDGNKSGVASKAAESVRDSDGFAVPSLAPPAKKARKATEEAVNGGGTPKAGTPKVDEPGQQQRKPTAFDPNRTVFLSNLSFTISEDDVRSFFEEKVGAVSCVSLARYPATGRSKGFGSIEFKDAASVEGALRLDTVPIDGTRKMYVSVYKQKTGEAPEKKPTSAEMGAPMFRYGTGLERNKLFVRKLHPSVDEARLEAIFGVYGRLKGVRVVTFKSGQSKGIAYVEFEDDAAAEKALAATNGMTVEGRQIEVAVSNPPAHGGRAPAGQQQEDLAREGGRQRSRVDAFAPRQIKMDVAAHRAEKTAAKRTVATPASAAPVQAATPVASVAAAATTTKLSNEEFRNKFLLKP